MNGEGLIIAIPTTGHNNGLGKLPLSESQIQSTTGVGSDVKYNFSTNANVSLLLSFLIEAFYTQWSRSRYLFYFD